MTTATACPCCEGRVPAGQVCGECGRCDGQLEAWIRGLQLRPAAPIPPTTAAPNWAARLANRCRAIWARDRQETQ